MYFLGNNMEKNQWATMEKWAKIIHVKPKEMLGHLKEIGYVLPEAKSLKELGAAKVYLTATFSLFTNGIENFKKAYDENLFDRVYSTNLTYVSKELDNEDRVI